MSVVEIKNSHTTKLRLDLDLNDVGLAAGFPRHVCLKSNWSEGFESGDICELEARFYHLMRNQLSAPVPKTYYADWDGDGGGRGIVIMEDLGSVPGEFGHSSHHLGVDGVAKGLETLAVLHGALWASPLLDEQAWLQSSMDTPVDTDQLLRMYNYWTLNLRKPAYQAILPKWIYETPELFAQAYDELAAFEREQTTPRCLVHGDAHQGNSFLRASGERVWHDWQLVRKGRPWRDLTYFMRGRAHYRGAASLGLGPDQTLSRDADGRRARRGAQPGRRLGTISPLAGLRYAGMAGQRRPVGPGRPSHRGAVLHRRRGSRHHKAADGGKNAAADDRTGNRRPAHRLGPAALAGTAQRAPDGRCARAALALKGPSALQHFRPIDRVKLHKRRLQARPAASHWSSGTSCCRAHDRGCRASCRRPGADERRQSSHCRRNWLWT